MGLYDVKFLMSCQNIKYMIVIDFSQNIYTQIKQTTPYYEYKGGELYFLLLNCTVEVH